MRSGRRFVAAAVAGVAIAVWTGLAAAQPEVRAAVEEGNRRFVAAFLRGDGKAIGELYTASAEAFPPNGEVVRGREAIARFWQSVIDGGIKGVAVTTLETEAQGDLAYEVGRYALTGEGGKPVDQGKYVVVWKREDGQWKLHRDIWNTSLPAAK